MPTGVLSYASGLEMPVEEEVYYEAVEEPQENEVVARLEPVQSTSFTVNASPETATTSYAAYPNDFTTDFTTTLWGGDTNLGTIPNPAYTTYTIQAPQIDYSPFVRASDLEKFFKRIYKVISDHTTINVTEEEFLKLIQEDDKDGTDD